MKKTILFSYLLLLNVLGFSQNTSTLNELRITDSRKFVDTCVITFQYKMVSIPNANNPDKQKFSTMMLQIGRKMSKFFDYEQFKMDSIIQQYDKEKKSSGEIFTLLLSSGIGKKTSGMNYFKNYPEGKNTYTNDIPFVGYFQYSEENVKMNWKTERADSVVCDYQCKKATTTFRGRNYTAWYAVEIPISDGPWKFWGLPGMILKVSDDEGHYSFECESIMKPRQTNLIYMLDKKYINTTRKEYNEILKKFFENPNAFIESSGIIKGELPKIKPRPYNPIELSE